MIQRASDLRSASRALILTSLLAGCGAGSEPRPPAEAAPEHARAVGAEAPASSTGEVPPSAEQPPPDAPPSDAPPAGRLAFIACEGERKSICTKELRRVCAEVDNGIRCITTPCDSTDQREFGNACMACAEPKTTGYWPVACAELSTGAATARDPDSAQVL